MIHSIAEHQHHRARPHRRDRLPDPSAEGTQPAQRGRPARPAGTTPVTRASGKTRGVYFRWAANTRARKAITAFAHNARLQSPWAAKLYTNARNRGKRNPHATRIVARAWLRIIWACWHNNTAYDPTKHRAAIAAVTRT